MDRIVEDAVNEAIAEKDAELIQRDAELKFYKEFLKKHNINVDYH